MILGSVRSGHGDFGDISVNVPLQHWSYEFIERFEARGALRNLGDGIKPLSRLAVARALVAMGPQAVVVTGHLVERLAGKAQQRLHHLVAIRVAGHSLTDREEPDDALHLP